MKIVIVGAGYAGLMCAFRLRRLCRERAEITVVDRSDRFVERVRLHEFIRGAPAPAHELAPMLRAHGVHFVRGSLAAIDRERKRALVGDQSLEYDRLVLALGSRTDRRIPGALEHALDFDRAVQVRENILSMTAGHIVVIGAGLTGIEAASELREARPELDVSLVFRGQFAPMLSEPARRHARSTLEALGVRVRSGLAVRAFERGAIVTDDASIPCDLALNCAGFAAPGELASLGLAVDRAGFARVDPWLRSVTDSAISVIGDAASVEGHEALHKSCKTAMPLAAHCADVLYAELSQRAPEPFRYRDTGVCVSLGRSQAVIQSYRDGRAPEGRVLTGRLAIWLKEAIVRYTTWSIRAEASRRFAYRWLSPKSVPTIAAQTAS
ncbi:MAG: FAD-dependent oxidoreductase [Polyangiales bacterium]